MVYIDYVNFSKDKMCILSFEIEQLALDALNRNIHSRLEICNPKSLLQLCLVSRRFHRKFYPILQEINTDPLKWAINHKHEALFGVWLNTVNASLYTTHKTNLECAKWNWAMQQFDVTIRYNTTEEIKEYCSKRIFKLAGECNVDIDFVKMIWMTLCKNGFKRPSLCDYFSHLKSGRIVDKPHFHEDLLKDNSAHNVLYHMEWNHIRAGA